MNFNVLGSWYNFFKELLPNKKYTKIIHQTTLTILQQIFLYKINRQFLKWGHNVIQLFY